jgi:hypothetical protein
MSRTKSALLTLALLLAAVPASGQTLTRIETKPFYGATVTIEEGVRVFRPLPPTSHMIINPGGKTPVSLSINEYRDYSGGAVVPALGGGEVHTYGGGVGWPLWGRGHDQRRHLGKHHQKAGYAWGAGHNGKNVWIGSNAHRYVRHAGHGGGPRKGGGGGKHH